MLRAEAGEFARLLVIAAVVLEVLLLRLVLGRPGFAARLGDARAAEQDDRRADAALGQDHLGLQQFELQPDRAQFAPRHELGVVPGQPVGRRQASAACPARSWRAPDPRPNAAAASIPPFPSDSCFFPVQLLTAPSRDAGAIDPLQAFT